MELCGGFWVEGELFSSRRVVKERAVLWFLNTERRREALLDEPCTALSLL